MEQAPIRHLLDLLGSDAEGAGSMAAAAATQPKAEPLPAALEAAEESAGRRKRAAPEGGASGPETGVTGRPTRAGAGTRMGSILEQAGIMAKFWPPRPALLTLLLPLWSCSSRRSRGRRRRHRPRGSGVGSRGSPSRSPQQHSSSRRCLHRPVSCTRYSQCSSISCSCRPWAGP